MKPLLLLILLSFSSSIIAQEAKKESSDHEVLILVDEPGEFPGGFEAKKKYLSKNLQYPKDAQNNGIEGHVFVQFIIENDGSLSDIKVVKGIGGGCDEEALRLIKEMPKWTPGKDSGAVVRQKYIQRIQFSKT